MFNFNGTSNMTIANIWIEHQMCLYWGANTDNLRGIEQGRAAGHPVELLVNGLAKMSEVSSLDALQASRACG